jgi:hypothetical protein
MTRLPPLVRPISRLLASADDLLRGDSASPLRARAATLERVHPHLLLLTVVFGGLYGATMGAFGGVSGDHWLQVLYSAVKVPMLLQISFALSLPSFFVLNTLLGVRADFALVMRSLVCTQAGLTIVLAALAPMTAFWYVSFSGYDAALMFNAAMFAVATLAAQWMLRRSYRPLILGNPRHRLLLRIWLLIYGFVAIQMAWVLRPFIGDPAARTSFFRHQAWGNAYIELFKIARHSVGLR